MRTIVFLDLDGTFWNHEVIPASALKAVKEARERNNLVFVNTGRARSTAMNALKNVDVDGFVFSAGTEVWLDGKRIFYHPMPADQVKRLMRIFDARGIGYACEGSGRTFANAKYQNYLRQHISENRVSNSFVDLPGTEDMKADDFAFVMKISVCLDDDQHIEDVLEAEQLEFTPFGKMHVKGRSGELTSRDFSKGTALNLVRSLVDPQARTMALGDSENDISMLKAADVGICMGNGTKHAKAAADWITDPIGEDGLAKAFAREGLTD